MVEAIDELAVDLVGDQQEVVLLHEVADEIDVLFSQHTAGRVLWSVDDQHSRLRSHERCQLVEVHAKAGLLTQRHTLRHSADELHLRGVRGIPRVGKDHLVTRLDAREKREQQDVLGSRDQDHLGRVDLRTQRAADETGDRLARLIYPAGGRVVRVAVLHRADRSLDDVVGRGEIGLADLQVDDPLAVSFQPPRLGEHLESALRSEARHALRELDRHVRILVRSAQCTPTSAPPSIPIVWPVM